MNVTGEPARFGYAIYRAQATAKHALQPTIDTEGSAEFIRGRKGGTRYIVHGTMASPVHGDTRPPPTDIACISPYRIP
jgi:hypothetical protein